MDLAPVGARIRSASATAVSLPVRHRVVSSVRDTDHVIYVLVRISTDAGVEGSSYVAGFTRHKAAAIRRMVLDLEEVIVGCDAAGTGAVWDRMWRASTLAGHAGLSIFALSAIDLALWDIQGKLLRVPLHRLLGTRRHSVPAYASEACWLQESALAVANEAAGSVDEGFTAVKMRFGRADPKRDIEALAEVRSAVGGDVTVLVDVNQGWSRHRAYEVGRRLAEYNVGWLEEPLPAADIEGLAELRRALPVSIAAGENAYVLEGVRALLEHHAVSVLTPDLQRVGGVTGWIRAAALAEAWHVPITSHLFTEVSIHLLAAARSTALLEWVTWLTPILVRPLERNGGVVPVPDLPGLGIEFDPIAVKRYTLE